MSSRGTLLNERGIAVPSIEVTPPSQGKNLPGAKDRAHKAKTSQGSRASKLKSRKKSLYPEHLAAEEVETLINEGALLKATLRINATDRTQAFATVAGLPCDIFIKGTKSQNRAVEGDEVALLVSPPHLWHQQDKKVPPPPPFNDHHGLLASPAFLTSASGGELAFNLEEDLSDSDIDEAFENMDVADDKVVSDEFSKNVITPWYRATDQMETITQIAAKLEELSGWRATADVVAIIKPSRRRESVVGIIQRQGGGKKLLLVPSDPRLPQMLVKTKSLPHDCARSLQNEANNSAAISRTFVLGRMVGWESNKGLPACKVIKAIGQAGSVQAETQALLAQERIIDDDQFSSEVLRCLPKTPWKISDADLKGRRDFRSNRVFSIDPLTARDLDDALSIVKMADDTYKVGVHIADVSHFVKAESALDAEASERSTSVYLVDRVIPMLPRLLCEELCSLKPGVDRLAFSIEWEMNGEGDVLSTWAGKSVICSGGQLTYPMVQHMIERTSSADCPGPEDLCRLHCGYEWKDVVSDCMMLHSIAKKLRKKRFDGGALRLDNVRLTYDFDDDGYPIDCSPYIQKEANQLVEEFMLLANMTTARMISDVFPDRALLRCHPPPNAQKMAELATSAREQFGVLLETTSAGALQKSLQALRSGSAVALDPAAIDVITLLATKPMQVARYFSTSSEPDQGSWRHYALAVDRYTHFTSPIRRYPDIIVHRLLAALLDQGHEQEQEHTALDRHHRLPPGPRVQEVAAHANDRKIAAKAAQDGSIRVYLALMLYSHPRVESGVVMGLNGSKFFDVYVPRLGIDVRMYTADMFTGGEGGAITEWNAGGRELTIDKARNNKNSVDYSCVDNLAKLSARGDVAKAKLPLTLRLLSNVPLLLSAQRSRVSGSPNKIIGRLWLEEA